MKRRDLIRNIEGDTVRELKEPRLTPCKAR